MVYGYILKALRKYKFIKSSVLHHPTFHHLIPKSSHHLIIKTFVTLRASLFCNTT